MPVGPCFMPDSSVVRLDLHTHTHTHTDGIYSIAVTTEPGGKNMDNSFRGK